MRLTRQLLERDINSLRQLAVSNSDVRLMAVVTAYEDARVDGLCHEGAWECALEAMRALYDSSVTSER